MDFDTYVLIAYSTVGGPAGGQVGYWTDGITQAQELEETKQFREAAAWLLEEYPSKTFVFENWEGDWASRAGSYDAGTPATDMALASMTKWLAARQSGVTEARAGFRHANAKGNVYFAAEVNLVQTSRKQGFPNMINRVIPYIQLDMVSYSSYDTMRDEGEFQAAL